MGNNIKGLGYRHVFIFSGLILLVLSALRCEAGVFLTSIMFVMPHMEKLYRQKQKTSNSKAKFFLNALFITNLVLCGLAFLVFFGCDVVTTTTKPVMLITKSNIQLFSFSFRYLIAAAIDGIWCILNIIFIWLYV